MIFIGPELVETLSLFSSMSLDSGAGKADSSQSPPQFSTREFLQEMFNEMVEKKQADLISTYYHPDFSMWTNGKQMTYAEMDSLHRDVYKTPIRYQVTFDDEAVIETGDRLAVRIFITIQTQDDPAREIEVLLIADFFERKIHRIWELTFPDWTNLDEFEPVF